MLERLFKIIRKEEPTIEKVSIEDLLELMSGNKKEPTKESAECINTRFLYEDEEFQYYGRIRTKKCKRIKTIIFRIQNNQIKTKPPNLKKIKGWEFKHQVMDNFYILVVVPPRI